MQPLWRYKGKGRSPHQKPLETCFKNTETGISVSLLHLLIQCYVDIKIADFLKKINLGVLRKKRWRFLGDWGKETTGKPALWKTHYFVTVLYQ